MRAREIVDAVRENLGEEINTKRKTYEIGDRVIRHLSSEPVDKRPDPLDDRWTGPYEIMAADACGKNYKLKDVKDGRILPHFYNWRFLHHEVERGEEGQEPFGPAVLRAAEANA